MSIPFRRWSILAITLIASEPAVAIEPSPDPDHSRTLAPRRGDLRYYNPVPPFDCCVPCDYVPRRSYPLFLAREVLQRLITPVDRLTRS